MKKIISLILAIAIFASIASVAYAEEAVAEFQIPEKVEISFKVGDSTLMINGNAVEVETPYIAGEGTTLVPLRVITEAFGAKVTWVNETKEIILEYPDVNITLQIDNVSAKVNEHTEALPVAPVLSPNGVTMVPLRFISETFGATVGYDNATAAITVVKETAAEDSTISSSTDLPRIGDSYWNWSVMTPSSMMMTERYSDGTFTAFEDDSENALYIEIYDLSDEEDMDKAFEAYYQDAKDYYFYGLTLSKDEKGTDEEGNRTFRITGRDKEEYCDYYAIFKGENCFEISFFCPVGSEQIETLKNVVNSFKATFAADENEKAQTHDLSNVDEEGYRFVEDDDLKISFKVPAECANQEISQLNMLMFINDATDVASQSVVAVAVYSLEEGMTAQKRATEEREYEAKYYNPEKVTVSEVSELEFAGETAYYYTLTTDGITGGDYTAHAVFFTKGEYIYYISVAVGENNSGFFEKLTETFTAEELDSEETGVFLEDTKRETEGKTVSNDNWSLTLLPGWQEFYSFTTFSMYMHENGAAFFVSSIDEDSVRRTSDLKDYATKQLNLAIEGEEDVEVIQKVTSVDINGRKYYTFTVLYNSGTEENPSMVYNTLYYTYISGKVYEFDFGEPELLRGGAAMGEFIDIMSSLEAVKD